MKLAREEVCGNSACEHLFFFSLSLFTFVYTYMFTPMLHSYHFISKSLFTIVTMAMFWYLQSLCNCHSQPF